MYPCTFPPYASLPSFALHRGHSTQSFSILPLSTFSRSTPPVFPVGGSLSCAAPQVKGGEKEKCHIGAPGRNRTFIVGLQDRCCAIEPQVLIVRLPLRLSRHHSVSYMPFGVSLSYGSFQRPLSFWLRCCATLKSFGRYPTCGASCKNRTCNLTIIGRALCQLS